MRAVLFADDVGGESGFECGGERIDGGIDALFGDLAFQIDERVKVLEGASRGRVGRVVGGDVHGLHRC